MSVAVLAHCTHLGPVVDVVFRVLGVAVRVVRGRGPVV